MGTKTAPISGYILKNWDLVGYRSTAHAYLKREGLLSVENKDGNTYTLKEIEDSMIGPISERKKVFINSLY